MPRVSAEQSSFSGGVSGNLRLVGDRLHGRNIDDATAGFFQKWISVLGAEKSAAQVGFGNGVPIVQRVFVSPAITLNAGIVAEHIDAAKNLRDLRHQGLDLLSMRMSV